MKPIKSFFKRISNDIKHKELLPLKVLFFVHASVFFVLYPYLTIHMRELGINVEETAVMSAVIPVISIIMPPLSGLVADKIGNFKVILAVFSSLGGVAALLLLLVPVGRVSIIYPTTVDFSLGCVSSSDDVQKLTALASQYSCNPIHPYAYDVNMRIENCGVSCKWSNNRENILRKAVTYIVKIRNIKEETTQVFRYPLHSDKLSLDIPTVYQSNHITLPNNMIDKQHVIKLSQHTLYFPMNGVYGLNCEEGDTDSTCSFGRNDTLHRADGKNWNQNLTFTARVAAQSNVSQEVDRVLSLSKFHDTNVLNKFLIEKVTNINKKIENTNKTDAVNHKEAKCVDYFSAFEISVELLYEDVVHVDNNVTILNNTETLENCSITCMATAERHDFCSNDKENVEIDPSFTFWSYLSVRVLITMLGGTAYAMFEGAVIAILREQEGDYGLQRIYGILGGMISSPLSGLLIDWASAGKGYTDFKPAFYLYAILKAFSGFLILTISLDFKSPASNILKDFIEVLKNVEIVALFAMSLVLGSLWGFIESFLFWFLQDLGGSRSLMGITITVGGIAGIPLLVLSGPIIDKVGHANVIFLGFLFYAARLVGYSFIYNPWMCLIFEAMEGVTSSLAFTAIVTYAARLSTTTTDTSVQGLLGGVYFGVGKGTGSLIGGYLMVTVGTRPTYQILAVVAVITGIGYFAFNKLYLLKRPQVEGNDICKKTKKIPKDVESTVDRENNEKDKLNNKKHNLYTEDKDDDRNEQIKNNESDNTRDLCGVDNPSYIEESAVNNSSNTQYEDVELSSVEENSRDGGSDVKTTNNNTT